MNSNKNTTKRHAEKNSARANRITGTLQVKEHNANLVGEVNRLTCTTVCGSRKLIK